MDAQQTEMTNLDAISELGLRLAEIARTPDEWEKYRVSQESKDVVIDRIQNHIDTLIKREQARILEITRRALHAETEWATFRELARSAYAIMNPIVPVHRDKQALFEDSWIKRAGQALKSPSLEHTERAK